MKANKSTRAEKVMWLLRNQAEWEGFGVSFSAAGIGPERLFRKMLAAGLYSPKTEWSHANVVELVSEARLMRRMGKHQRGERAKI